MTTRHQIMRDCYVELFTQAIDIGTPSPTRDQLEAATEALGVVMVGLWAKLNGLPATNDTVLGLARASSRAMVAWAESYSERN